MALCKAKTVCFSKLSTCFDSPAKAKSCLRRIQRFFAKHSICQDLVARFIFQMLPKKEKYRLAIDRTNWKFGNTDINIFMLAVAHDGVAYPLLLSMLPKKGNLNSQERIDLVQGAITSVSSSTCISILSEFWNTGERRKVYSAMGWTSSEFFVRGRNDFHLHFFDLNQFGSSTWHRWYKTSYRLSTLTSFPHCAARTFLLRGKLCRVPRLGYRTATTPDCGRRLGLGLLKVLSLRGCSMNHSA